MCIYLWAHVPWLLCGGQGIALWSLCSPSTFLWVSGKELRFPGLPRLLSHPRGCSFDPIPFYLKQETGIYSVLSVGRSFKSPVFLRSLEERACERACWKRCDCRMQALWDGWEVAHMHPSRLSICGCEEWISTHRLRVQSVFVGWHGGAVMDMSPWSASSSRAPYCRLFRAQSPWVPPKGH